MKGPIALLVLTVLAGSHCAAPSKEGPIMSRTPVSVRGWLQDIEMPAKEGSFKVRDAGTETVRKVELFKQTTLYVENAPFVSGAFGENGAFILLDVPPGDITISFQRPGVPDVKLTLQHVPASADVLLPGLIIRNGAIDLLDPGKVEARLASTTGTARSLNSSIIVAGHKVPLREVPLNDMMGRREYPTPVAVRAK